MPVVLDNGEEGADCMVDLSAGSGSDLVIRQVLNRSVNCQFTGVAINESGHGACGMICFVAAQEVPKGLHGGSFITLVLEGV